LRPPLIFFVINMLLNCSLTGRLFCFSLGNWMGDLLYEISHHERFVGRALIVMAGNAGFFVRYNKAGCDCGFFVFHNAHRHIIGTGAMTSLATDALGSAISSGLSICGSGKTGQVTAQALVACLGFCDTKLFGD